MRWFILVLLVLMHVPGAIAGDASDPEIVDEDDDVRGPGNSPVCQPGACSGAPGFADILSGWVNLEGDNVIFRMDSANNENAYGDADYTFHFTVDGTEYFAGLEAGQSATFGGDGRQVATGVATEATWIDTIITITVPLAAIGGPGSLITNLYSTAAVHAGLSGSFTDRGPSSDFGRDYLIPSDGPEVISLNVTTPELLHEFTGNGTDAIFNLTWTGPANVTLSLDMNGTGSMNLTVVDANGTPQFACNCENTTMQNATFVGVAGNYSVFIGYIGFNGTVSLKMMETPPPPPPMMEPETNATANETVEPPAEDSPSVPFVVLLGAIGLMAVVRRRLA